MLVGGLLAFSKQKRVPRRVADTQCGTCSTCPHNVARSQRPFAACCWYTARSHRSPRSHRPFSPRHKRQGARSARSRLRDLAPFCATFTEPFPADCAVLSVPFPVFRVACRAAFFGCFSLDASLHFRISSRALPASRFASEDPRCPRFCSRPPVPAAHRRTVSLICCAPCSCGEASRRSGVFFGGIRGVLGADGYRDTAKGGVPCSIKASSKRSCRPETRASSPPSQCGDVGRQSIDLFLRRRPARAKTHDRPLRRFPLFLKAVAARQHFLLPRI